MSSFRQLSPRLPALLIDAASSVIQVGLMNGKGAITWETSSEESGVAIFQAVDKLGVDLHELNAFVFCEGPGSTLGIRTAAMALRIWVQLNPRPVFTYSSLALVAWALAPKEITVIADARRDLWHQYRIGEGLRRVPAAELRGDLVMPEDFRSWARLPDNLTRVPYLLPNLLALAWDADLLHETDAPDAFLHEEPSYATWTPQIHQGPQPR